MRAGTLCDIWIIICSLLPLHLSHLSRVIKVQIWASVAKKVGLLSPQSWVKGYGIFYNRSISHPLNSRVAVAKFLMNVTGENKGFSSCTWLPLIGPSWEYQSWGQTPSPHLIPRAEVSQEDRGHRTYPACCL